MATSLLPCPPASAGFDKGQVLRGWEEREVQEVLPLLAVALSAAGFLH